MGLINDKTPPLLCLDHYMRPEQKPSESLLRIHVDISYISKFKCLLLLLDSNTIFD